MMAKGRNTTGRECARRDSKKSGVEILMIYTYQHHLLHQVV